MRKIWRLCKSSYADTAFDGQGAAKYGGRWNSKGVQAVYTSSTLALAALELLPHLGTAPIPQGFVAIPVTVPAGVKIESLPSPLPKSWRTTPPPSSLAKLGDKWAEEAQTAILEVPSVVVPQEFNYLLNPAHPDYTKLTIGAPESFDYDPRLVR
jgi:RES domain-containing protein